MKKSFILLLLSFCLCGQVLAMTYTNEPKDYDSIPWGSTAADFARYGKQIVLSEQSETNISIYKPAEQSLFIFNKKFDEISYYFYQGKFFLVKATKYNDKEMSPTLYTTIKSRHGNNTQQNDNLSRKSTTYWWQGDTTFIVLTNDYFQGNTHLTFYYKPLYQSWSLSKKSVPNQSGKIKERG